MKTELFSRSPNHVTNARRRLQGSSMLAFVCGDTPWCCHHRGSSALQPLLTESMSHRGGSGGSCEHDQALLMVGKESSSQRQGVYNCLWSKICAKCSPALSPARGVNGWRGRRHTEAMGAAVWQTVSDQPALRPAWPSAAQWDTYSGTATLNCDPKDGPRHLMEARRKVPELSHL